MKFISDVTEKDIERASQALFEGNLVAFPTETVYGLGASATDEKAVNRMYEVKGRPKGHPVIVHVSSPERIYDWAIAIPDFALELGKKYWPGPLTLVLKRSDLAKDFITGGQDSVAIRVPNHPIALKLLSKFEILGGKGVVAPSANLFGRVSPTEASHVNDDLNTFLEENDIILDGGVSEIGIESTIISCLDQTPLVLRSGLIDPKSQFSLEFSLEQDDSNRTGLSRLKFSGNFGRHYAPNAEINLNGIAKPGDGFIALRSIPTPLGAIRISSPDSEKDFAKILYESLRRVDCLKLKSVTVQLEGKSHISKVIEDRLKKASFKKT